ncbi:MAG: flavodoxin domain-containing protein [Candidatus Freyarchaeum deiterrae]
MPGKKVLIAYGTRYGSTEEISQEIGKILKKEGLEVQIVDLKKTKSKEWPSLTPFDGVLVGSSVKMFRWMNEPQEFLKKHKAEIQKKEKILGVFVSCGMASVPETCEKAKSDEVEKILAKIGIEADIYDAFGGVYDFSESSRMSGMDKRMMKMGLKQMEKDYGMKIDEEGKNDFRDWEQIQNFAKKFAAMVKK